MLELLIQNSRTPDFKIEEARGHACGWLEQNSVQLAGFVGAYLAGSTAWADRKAEFRTGSDVDLFVVVNGPDLPKNVGKTLRNGVILDINFVTFGSISDPSRILGDYHLAGTLVCDGLLADPQGKLAKLRQIIAEKL